jgi:hypothetical protein
LVEDAEIGLETNLPQPLFIKRGDLFFLLDKGGGPLAVEDLFIILLNRIQHTD